MNDDSNVIPFTGLRRVEAVKLSDYAGEVFVWSEQDGTFRWCIDVRGQTYQLRVAYSKEGDAWQAGYDMLGKVLTMRLEGGI